jgi:hypothetical protein
MDVVRRNLANLPIECGSDDLVVSLDAVID